MNGPIDAFWERKIDHCRDAFERNHFEVHTAAGIDAVKPLILEEIFPKLSVSSVSWGDSVSMLSSGILAAIEQMPGIRLIRTFEEGVSREELVERRRQALLVDLFLTGSNAATGCGKLVNLDMIGNRVAGLTFGPRHVIVVLGRNKLVSDVAAAMARVKQLAAPMNAIRHTGWKTPCVKTGECMDCKSPHRICNTWTITEKAYPKGRIKIILVNEDLGL